METPKEKKLKKQNLDMVPPFAFLLGAMTKTSDHNLYI